MRDFHYIVELEQATALLKPQRLDILRRLDEPRTCPELAVYFDDTPQKIYYHIKALESAGLVEKVEEKRVRGTVEGHYVAVARSYWLSPKLIGQIGGAQPTRDQASLRVLLGLAEEVIEDAGRLGNAGAAGTSVPSMSLAAHIYLPDARRRGQFLQEVQQIFQDLARKYGLPAADIPTTDEQGFRLVLLCYPKPNPPPD